jgi:hypothetical protein
MSSAATREMEYLGAIRGRNNDDATLARELGQRLEALRRFDQHFCDADWQPRTERRRGDSLHKDLDD